MWSGSGGVEQGEADYLGAIGRRIYVQPPVSSTFGSFFVKSIYIGSVSILLLHAIQPQFQAIGLYVQNICTLSKHCFLGL